MTKLKLLLSILSLCLWVIIAVSITWRRSARFSVTVSKECFKIVHRKMMVKYFSNQLRFWKLQLFTYSGIMSCCCDPMLSQRESFYFCHAHFSKKRQSKKHETLEIFGQTMTRVKKDIEMLLTYFWINAQTIPSDRENSIFRVASTHHIEHPTKNTTTVLHQFCLIFCQTRRKKFH